MTNLVLKQRRKWEGQSIRNSSLYTQQGDHYAFPVIEIQAVVLSLSPHPPPTTTLFIYLVS